MTQTDFQEVLALVEAVMSQDHKVGSILHLLLQHIANMAGLNAPSEAVPAQPEAASSNAKGKN